MVARLKLKGIDGRAPPGVNIAARRSVSALKSEARKGWRLTSPSLRCATCSNCGKPLKLRLPSRFSKDVGGQVNRLGYGNNVVR
jgi:hypothetical protein